jgi:hypothetical protein
MQLLTSHASADWYTPAKYIEMVRAVLETIDCDPASDPIPQRWIKATTYYTPKDDGLKKQWFGSVFLNPPYGKHNGKSNQEVWSKYLEREYLSGNVTQAILLINSTHGYKWYEAIWLRWPCCCVRERIEFVTLENDQLVTYGPAKRGQTFVYFGQNYRRFIEVFQPIGRILLP